MAQDLPKKPRKKGSFLFGFRKKGPVELPDVHESRLIDPTKKHIGIFPEKEISLEEAALYCSVCRRRNEEGLRFCPVCGRDAWKDR